MGMKKSDFKDTTIRGSNPSTNSNLPPGKSNSGGEPDDLAQPSMSKPSDTKSVGAVTTGKSVSFPDASDKTSAGGIKTTSTLVEKTGKAVSFPPAADTSMQPKPVSSFVK